MRRRSPSELCPAMQEQRVGLALSSRGRPGSLPLGDGNPERANLTFRALREDRGSSADAATDAHEGGVNSRESAMRQPHVQRRRTRGSRAVRWW